MNLSQTQFNIQVVVYRLTENASNPENLLSSNGNASTNFNIVRSQAKVFLPVDAGSFRFHAMWKYCQLPCARLPYDLVEVREWFGDFSFNCVTSYVDFVTSKGSLNFCHKKTWGRFKTQLGFFLSHWQMIDYIWS